jgi:hypothetical protein
MTFSVLLLLNVSLLVVFAILSRRPQLLGFARGGRWYLTWLATGTITLMDELTSVFYAPAEAYRFIGERAIFFLFVTSLVMHLLSTRMVEIAEILEHHNIRGGGVYSFSYLVLGPAVMAHSATSVVTNLSHHSWAHAIQAVTIGVSSCVLAYSGIESVIQTAGLVEGWRDITRAYWFLALTVGVVTPLVSALALSAPINFADHEGDLITHWATMVGNAPFGVVVGLFGSIILIMAVNTAYVASSELLERVAHRYRFAWFTVINRRGSLYRIHVCNGLLYTSIILLTAGSQHVLAEMYAIGLLASFCINLGCLLVYRYVHGSSELRVFHTSRVGTLLFECILVACLVYLMVHKPYGTALWASVVTVLLAAGLPLSRRYGPEVKEVQQSDFTMKMILALAESDGPLHMYFRRPGEVEATQSSPDTVFITFFSPRAPIPPKAATNHFRFPIQGGSVYGSICAILALIQEEFEGRDVHIHLGWPLSSWLDRLATGVFVVQLMRLPQRFPDLCFSIEYETHHVLTQQAESDVTIGIHPIEVSSGNRGLPSSNGALHSRALDPIRR